MSDTDPTARLRRPPPAFRSARVVDARPAGGRLVRLRIEGPELAGFGPVEPAASLRLLVPAPHERGGSSIAVPVWNGNEFLRADGSRPPIRTLTPLAVDDDGSLSVEVVRHGDGPLATWAAGDPVGDPVAVSGPGRGSGVDPSARRVVLAGDESALPAIATVLASLDAPTAVTVLVELEDAGGEVDLPAHPGADVRWLVAPASDRRGTVLLDALRDLPIDDDTRLWVAGEAAGVQRIRQHLFTERGVARSAAVVRGYWKQGRTGAGAD